MDNSGPVEVIPVSDPKAVRGAKLVYASGITVTHGTGFGVEFFGANGQVKVNRGKFIFILDGKTIASFKKDKTDGDTSCKAQVQIAEKEYLKDAKIKLYESENHVADFLACVQSRKKPNTSEQVGGRSAICCHLLNQSYYHHVPMKWDPAKFEFRDGKGEAKWLTREYRGDWKV